MVLRFSSNLQITASKIRDSAGVLTSSGTKPTPPILPSFRRWSKLVSWVSVPNPEGEYGRKASRQNQSLGSY
ncbi:hypothetical protein SK128_007173, partial [Halocaridina rubra]